MMQDFVDPSLLAPLSTSMYSFMPQIDVEEDEQQLKVYAELPGMKEQDVEIVLEPHMLVVRGEKHEEEARTTRRGRGRIEERRYGSFERRIPLSSEIQEDKIEAKFDRGLLMITLPKSEQARAQAKRIKIQGGEQSHQQQQQPQQRGGAGSSKSA
jgi:HSP20 family protein